jgi:hypothetical protein
VELRFVPPRGTRRRRVAIAAKPRSRRRAGSRTRQNTARLGSGRRWARRSVWDCLRSGRTGQCMGGLRIGSILSLGRRLFHQRSRQSLQLVSPKRCCTFDAPLECAFGMVIDGRRNCPPRPFGLDSADYALEHVVVKPRRLVTAVVVHAEYSVIRIGQYAPLLVYPAPNLVNLWPDFVKSHTRRLNLFQRHAIQFEHGRANLQKSVNF